MPIYDAAGQTYDQSGQTYDGTGTTAPGFPRIAVAVAFDTNPLTTPLVWTSLAGYIRGVSTRRGRQHLLARTQAGEATIRLDNRDGRFDPTNTSSPYYPNVVPMRRIRIQAIYSSVTYDLFQGYVEDWGQEYGGSPLAGGGDTECVVRAVDGFKMLGLIDLVSFGDLVLQDSPVGFWRLDETASQTAHDSGSAGADGIYTGGVTLGQADRFGVARAARFDGVNDRIELGTPPALGITGDLTIEFFALCTAASGLQAIVNAGIFAGSPYEVWFLGTSAARQIKFDHVDGSGTIWSVTTPAFADSGSWHHYACVRDGMTMRVYKDGVLLGSKVVANRPGIDSYILAIGDINLGGEPFTGSLANVVIYDHALDPARIVAHVAAPFDVFPVEDSGTHLNAVLDAVGWPAAERTIGVGTALIQSVEPSGNALDWCLRIAEESENGLFQVAADGKLTFHSRSQMFSGDHTSSNATFGDGGGSELAYSDITMRYNDDDLYSTVKVPRDSGTTQVATDTAAVAAYGPRTLDRPSSLVSSDTDTLDAANYYLYRYKTPSLRVDAVSLVATFNSASTKIVQMLSRTTHHDRVTVKRRPTAGNTVTQESNIEGVSHDVDLNVGTWATTFAVTAADTNIYWILDDTTYSVLDTTTRVAF